MCTIVLITRRLFGAVIFSIPEDFVILFKNSHYFTFGIYLSSKNMKIVQICLNCDLSYSSFITETKNVKIELFLQ